MYMKEMIPKDDYGIFVDSKDTARVDSMFVAKFFEKRHDDVLKSIRNLDCSDEFRLRNFAETSYKDGQGKKQPCYAMTRDGFTFLAMGYRGEKAAKFKELYIKRFNEMEKFIKTLVSARKELYIKRFNEMEKFIKTLVSARKEFPLLTENIKLLYDDPKPYHFSNECDMINRIVIGMSAKQFRLEHGIEKGESIRPYLTEEQINMLELLQKVDVGLLVAFPNYEDRKRHLEWYKSKISTQLA